MEWKVYFEGSFWGHNRWSRAGKKLPIAKEFLWDEESWLVPAAYLCGKGLVVDFCIRVSPERIREFMGKWNLDPNSEHDGLDPEKQMQIDADNPLCIYFQPKLCLNGRAMAPSHACSLSWNPCLFQTAYPEEPEIQNVIDHYGLNSAYAWSIHRVAFPWPAKRRPRIKTLTLSLARGPVEIPGPHFQLAAPGDAFSFIHPASGIQHTLHVEEYEQLEFDHKGIHAERYDFPSYYIRMAYILAPELPEQSFSVLDVLQSDPPQEKTSPGRPKGHGSAASIGIIGGADGPVAIIVGGGSRKKFHVACSALHFHQKKNVTWRIVFREKAKEDITAVLI